MTKVFAGWWFGLDIENIFENQKKKKCLQVGGAEYDSAQWESMASQCQKCNYPNFC